MVRAMHLGRAEREFVERQVEEVRNFAAGPISAGHLDFPIHLAVDLPIL
jgi:hypothetical protein